MQAKIKKLTTTSPFCPSPLCHGSFAKCILVEQNSLNSCHIMTPVVNSLDFRYVLKASLQLYLHHDTAPTAPRPSAEDTSTGDGWRLFFPGVSGNAMWACCCRRLLMVNVFSRAFHSSHSQLHSICPGGGTIAEREGELFYTKSGNRFIYQQAIKGRLLALRGRDRFSLLGPRQQISFIGHLSS